MKLKFDKFSRIIISDAPELDETGKTKYRVEYIGNDIIMFTPSDSGGVSVTTKDKKLRLISKGAKHFIGPRKLNTVHEAKVMEERGDGTVLVKVPPHLTNEKRPTEYIELAGCAGGRPKASAKMKYKVTQKVPKFFVPEPPQVLMLPAEQDSPIIEAVLYTLLGIVVGAGGLWLLGF